MEGFKLRADIILLAAGLSLMATGIACWFWMWPIFPMTLEFRQLSLAALVAKWFVGLGALSCFVSGALWFWATKLAGLRMRAAVLWMIVFSLWPLRSRRIKV
jgi:hypothetical protein